MQLTLNLANIDNSDIKYTISKFPDGQQNVNLVTRLDNNVFSVEDFEIDTIKEYSVQIISRLNNFLDLELIICAVASLRELGVKEIHLYTPFFLGSRSDRKFEEGGNNYLKDIICPIINSLNFESVTVLDPHSDVLEACLKNFKKIPQEEIIFDILCSKEADKIKDNIILVSPDEGATKKIHKVAKRIGYKCDIITCSKERDINGNITKTKVPYNFKQYNSNTISCPDIIIVDDICDGGVTFINIAKNIREQLNPIYKTNIYLIVTHGIFSKGFEELSKYFDGIFTTNSYRSLLTGEDIKVKNGVHHLNII